MSPGSGQTEVQRRMGGWGVGGGIPLVSADTHTHTHTRTHSCHAHPRSCAPQKRAAAHMPPLPRSDPNRQGPDLKNKNNDFKKIKKTVKRVGSSGNEFNFLSPEITETTGDVPTAARPSK